MANVKEISIDAVLPFDYLSSLSDKEAATVAGWLLAPAVGLTYKWEDLGLDPEVNEHGGHTTLYRLRIRGHEAVRFEAFDYLIKVLKAVKGARIERAKCIDVEA